MRVPRSFFSIMALCGAALGLAGCQTPQTTTASPTTDGQVAHVVICWLHQPRDPWAREKLIAAAQSFRKIPGVVQVTTGNVLPSARPQVDSSFDVATVITFENIQALQTYLTHPDHLQAVQNVLQPLCRRYLVYDMVLSQGDPTIRTDDSRALIGPPAPSAGSTVP